MVTFLEKSGFNNIFSFTDPFKALDFNNSLDPSFFYVVSDFKMPGMSGLQFLDNVSLRFTTVKGIIVSSDHSSLVSLSDNYPVIEKSTPFFFRDLLSALKSD